ncbi:hypothetical protein [Frankia sp. AgB32]|uniref:non-homologous end-joining DNA ligase LigD n=1 Tax=Frankia sp. AgB32 TaxID=631119 RepID=UPI00201095E1|nr:hypothetical protein [Frankia sp. AgB32]MCK9897874.1 hypothetical protein [Frankia sp. AgB32]
MQELSHAVSAVVPDLVSWKWAVRERAGHARLDFPPDRDQQDAGHPIQPRAAPGAPVSAPLDWDELDDPSLCPDAVTLRTALDRLATRGDPFRAILAPAPPLPPLI